MKKKYEITCLNCGHKGYLENSPIGSFYAALTGVPETKCSKCGYVGGIVGPGSDFLK